MHFASDSLCIAAISSLFRRGSIHNKQLQYDIGVMFRIYNVVHGSPGPRLQNSVFSLVFCVAELEISMRGMGICNARIKPLKARCVSLQSHS